MMNLGQWRTCQSCRKFFCPQSIDDFPCEVHAAMPEGTVADKYEALRLAVIKLAETLGDKPFAGDPMMIASDGATAYREIRTYLVGLSPSFIP